MTYRERMAKMTTLPWCLLSGDFCDELDAKIGQVSMRVTAAEEWIKLLERKIQDLDARITACCDDSFKADVRAELAVLRADLARLRPS